MPEKRATCWAGSLRFPTSTRSSARLGPGINTVLDGLVNHNCERFCVGNRGPKLSLIFSPISFCILPGVWSLMTGALCWQLSPDQLLSRFFSTARCGWAHPTGLLWLLPITCMSGYAVIHAV